MEEALFDYTIDSYRLPTLNTRTRCLELLAMLEHVRVSDTPKAALAPMIEELAHSVRSDVAARAVLGADIAFFGDAAWWLSGGISEMADRGARLHAVLHERYESVLLVEISNRLDASHEKGDLEVLALDLLGEWTAQRFSRDYAYWRVRQFFFAPHGDRVEGNGAFERFAGLFKPVKREWTVLLRASNAFGERLPEVHSTIYEVLPERPAPKTADERERLYLAEPHDGVYLRVHLEAPDARTAREWAERGVAQIVALARLHAHRQDFKWGGPVLVYGSSGPRVLKASTPAIAKYPEPDVGTFRRHLNQSLRALLVRAGASGPAGWGDVLGSLELHTAAIRSDAVEAQFLALWGAFEALLPLSESTVRINKICSLAVPLLTRHYPRKLLINLHRDFLHCSRREYEEGLQRVGHGSHVLEKAALLVTAPDYEAERDRIYAALTPRNPLLRYRLWKLSRLLRDPPEVLDAMRAHAQRIDWHLRRIYRSRNLLIHGGRKLPFVDALVENLHLYFHQIVDVVEESFLRTPPPRSLTEALLVGQLSQASHERLLARMGRSVATPADRLLVVFGEGRLGMPADQQA